MNKPYIQNNILYVGEVDSPTLDRIKINKQDKLVSGSNIKTINGQSILGSGNISVGGGGSTNKRINILFIGNSYTANSISYVPFILKNVCPELKFHIGFFFLDGGSIAEHIVNLTGVPMLDEKGDLQIRQKYDRWCSFTNDDVKWFRRSQQWMDDWIYTEQWDIVSTHQSSSKGGTSWESNKPYIIRFQKEIMNKFHYPFKFGWDMVHVSRFAMTDIISLCEDIMKESCTQVLFPYGVAVESLRSISAISALGDGGNLTVDGSHLQSGIGQLAASYAIAYTIMKEANIEVPRILGEETIPSTDWVQSINTCRPLDLGTGAIGANEEYCKLAQIAAVLAVNNPYEIRDLNDYM